MLYAPVGHCATSWSIDSDRIWTDSYSNSQLLYAALGFAHKDKHSILLR